MKRPTTVTRAAGARPSISKASTNAAAAARESTQTRTRDRPGCGADIPGIALVACLPVALYWNTLGHGFVYDDFPGIVDNPLVAGATRFDDLCQLLGESWRPLVQVSYAATHVLFGFTPAAYHALNVALHAANALLVYALALQAARLWLPQRRCRLFAAAAGLIFAAHPLHSEAVAYVWGRSSSICAFFCFGSLLFLMLAHGEDSAAQRRFLFACAVASGLMAWKSKEEAIALPVLLAGFLWLSDRKLAAVAAALVPGALLAARWSDLSGLAGKVAHNQDLVLAGASPALPRAVFLMTEIRSAVFYYGGKFLIPVDLNVDPWVEPVEHFYELRFVTACLVLAGLGAAAFFLQRRQPAVSFGLTAFLASPLTAYAFMPLADVVAEHRVYTTGLGVALLAAYAIALKPKQGWMLLAAAITALSFAAFERSKVWAASETLWRDAESKSPQLARPHLNLGAAYQAAGRCDEALAEYRRALAVNPRLAPAYSNIASLRLHQGDPDGAEALLRKAIELSPRRIGPYVNLASIKLCRGQPAEAMKILDRAAHLGESAVLHLARGDVFRAMGWNDQAGCEYARAAGMPADSAEVVRRIAFRLAEMKAAQAPPHRP
jgi:tetratricopeptide (TPR) repeat protein